MYRSLGVKGLITQQVVVNFITTTHCITTQKNAVLIYFAAEA